MKQLKMGDILNLAVELEDSGMLAKEISQLPVYLGDDDELNGIHCAWFVQPIDPNNEDDTDLVAMINEDYGNVEIKTTAILIS